MLAPHKSFIQIPLILDQPGVGEGLLDQMAYPLYFSIDNKNQDHSKTAQAKFINPARLLSPREIWNYLFYGKGNFVILIFIAVMQNAIIYIYIYKFRNFFLLCLGISILNTKFLSSENKGT